jgi:hypothetical protein
MDKKVLRILLKHYTKIGHEGGIAKVIFDDEFEEIVEEIVKLFSLASINNSEAELCRCLDYEGTAEDGTCYYCREKLRDDYPA